MRRTKSFAVLVLLAISLTAQATPQCKQGTVDDLSKASATAYEVRTLAGLDTQKPYVGKVRIVIEHSLAEDDAKDRFVIKWFTSLGKAEAWLKSREHDELPSRQTRALKSCAKGI